MANHPNRSNHPSPRFKATYKGDVIGWYDTLAEAEAAIEAAREEEKREEQECAAAWKDTHWWHP